MATLRLFYHSEPRSNVLSTEDGNIDTKQEIE